KFLAQYDFIIEYVPSTNNMFTNMLSHLLADPLFSVPTVPILSVLDSLPTMLVALILAISLNPTFLLNIYNILSIALFIIKAL
ncbi:hypothetical protein HETIRDRAFT_42361, partial [Heterobasidion irregulare TC 32-1]